MTILVNKYGLSSATLALTTDNSNGSQWIGIYLYPHILRQEDLLFCFCLVKQ